MVPNKILVLIVESNLPTKLLDHRFNEMPGLVVATANDGDAALAMVNIADPSLVVADMGVSAEDGVNNLGRLHNLCRGRLILMTANDHEESRFRPDDSHQNAAKSFYAGLMARAKQLVGEMSLEAQPVEGRNQTGKVKSETDWKAPVEQWDGIGSVELETDRKAPVEQWDETGKVELEADCKAPDEQWDEIGKEDLETALRSLSMSGDPYHHEGTIEDRETPVAHDEYEGIIRLVVSTAQTARVVRFVKKLRVIPQFRVLRLAPSDHSDEVTILISLREPTSLKEVLLQMDDVLDIEYEVSGSAFKVLLNHQSTHPVSEDASDHPQEKETA